MSSQKNTEQQKKQVMSPLPPHKTYVLSLRWWCNTIFNMQCLRVDRVERVESGKLSSLVICGCRCACLLRGQYLSCQSMLSQMHHSGNVARFSWMFALLGIEEHHPNRGKPELRCELCCLEFIFPPELADRLSDYSTLGLTQERCC